MSNDEKESGITRRDFVIGAGAAGTLAAVGAAATDVFAQEKGKEAGKSNLLMTSVWLHERSWEGVKENLKTNDMVLIPIGSTENHGVHSPLMTDACWALTICEGVAKNTGAICAPPIFSAYSRGHMAYPGSINIRSEVLTDYIVDIARSMMFHGYKRFVLVNGHRVANLPPILCAGNKIHHAFGAAVGIIDAGLVAYKEVGALVSKDKGSEHGGDAETSMVLAYRPELVDMAKAGKQPPCPNGEELEAFMTHQIMLFPPKGDNNAVSTEKERHEYQHSPMESSKFASVEKGRKILDAVIKNATAAVLPLKDIKVELKYTDIIPI